MHGFDPAFPVDRIHPAAYNPRAIDDTAKADLQKSIRLLGFAKPVIVLASGLTIAGHQRSAAARTAGRNRMLLTA